MKKIIVLHTTIFILFFGIASSFGQTVSEEAKRHFNRGMAAVEMAKSPADYESAIKEFEQAARLAPDWPDVYYNLGIVQEKAEKYSDAVTNLKQYLRLAPNASDAEAVKSLIDKLEYKAEQVLSPKDCTDIFVSLNDESVWDRVGEGCNEVMSHWQSYRKRVGENLVEIVTAYRANVINPREPFKEYSFINIEGNKIRYRYMRDMIKVIVESEHEIEIISRDHVKGKTTETATLTGNAVYTSGKNFEIKTYSCEFIRKGADISAKNQYGDTPLHYAADEGHKEVADLFKKHGAR
jgi:tetratricopeptide (TPR) repeat protein